MKGFLGGLPYPMEGDTSTGTEVDAAPISRDEHHRWRTESLMLDLGYREDNGGLWYPVVGKFAYTHISSFTREEAFQLIAAAKVPLAGHDGLPRLEWLPEPDDCIAAPVTQTLYDIKNRGGAVANWPVVPTDVYITLFLLLRDAKFLHRVLRCGLTKASLQHALLLKCRAKAYLDALKDPRTRQVYGATWLQASLADAERDHKRHAWTAAAIQRELARDTATPETTARDSASVEAFIQGPLSETYKSLFDRDAGGNAYGPFARFGTAFFDLVGQPVAAGTIARALKPRSTRRKG